MKQLSISSGIVAAQPAGDRFAVQLDAAALSGGGSATADVTPPFDRYIVPGVYPDSTAGSTTTLTILSPDGSDAVITRGAEDYRLGGTARFRVDTARIAAPGLVASAVLAGRVLTISPLIATGAPAPSVALSVLTLDDVDVLGDAVAVGAAWTYTVPSSVSPQTVAFTLTATNLGGSDTDGGTVVVPAD